MLQRAKQTLGWRARRATAHWRSLPRFIVIGAQRSGTTSLFAYLTRHPSVRPAYRKEVHYFDLHYDRGEYWYRSHFALSSELKPGITTGEATPNYLAHPEAASRTHALVPDAKLLVLLRDPVERTHSSWRLNRRQGWETRTFEEAIEQELSQGSNGAKEGGARHRNPAKRDDPLRWSYLLKSQYADHLDRWLLLYPLDQLLIIQSEHLFSQPERPLKAISEFLEIQGADVSRFPRVNATEEDEIDPAIRSQVADYLAPYNQRLEQLVGTPFDWA